MSIFNQKAFSTRKTQNTISFPTGPALVWIAVVIFVGLLAGTAHAQTFVTQPTATTLWAGSQDITTFGTTGFSAPGSGVILQGAAISQFRNGPKNPDGLFNCQEPGSPTECLPVRHLWYGDSFNGLCRVDPEVDDPLATPVNGIGSFNVNLLTCVARVSGGFVPGQLTFDASTNTLYTVDISKTAAGILRIVYIPSGDNGEGSIDLIHIDSLLGTQSTRNAFGGCPQLRDPHNGNPVPTQPSSVALGPDGNLYTGSLRDGAIIRIISPATFNTNTDCDSSGDTGQSPTAKIQIPILSTDEQIGTGHTFGLGWIGHTLFGGDNVAPWLLLNADSCLTAANGNNTCGNPLVGGAPLPTEFLATQIGAPQAGVVSDAIYPNNAGIAAYFASISSLTRVTNVTSATSMIADLNYGGTFSIISGITPDPLDPANSTVYVGADPSGGGINGSGQIWKVIPNSVCACLPVAPVITSAVAGPGTGQATVAWTPTLNGTPILTYVVQTLLASPTGGAPTPSGLPNTTVTAPTTTATISGLTVGTTYVFAVQACNSTGCSAFSSFSSPVTAFAVQPASATNVVAVDAGTGTSANVAWTATNGGLTITSSTITPFLGGVTALPPTIIPGSGTSGTVSGLTCGNSYTFTVAVTNSAGTSPASAPSLPITISCTVSADVSVLETAVGLVNPGSQVTYTISIHNNGPGSAASVAFSETLPVPFVSSTTSQGVCQGTAGQTAFSCNLASLAAGATATVTVTVQLPSGTTGLFTNTVTVNVTDAAGTNIDPNLANNTAAVTVTAGGCPTAATTTDIQVTGASNNGNPVHGTPVTITWQIKDNQGTIAANCSTFTASTTSPTGDTYTINSSTTTQGSCSILNNQLSCNLGDIAGGATATVTVTATPSGAAPANSYAMTGSATFTGTDTNTANNTSTVLIGAQ